MSARRHVILVGLPGAGKSTVGPLVARALDRPFLDFDAELERRHGLPVAAQFAADGEPAFRSREAELARELAATPGMVLAPGGGWMTNPGASALLRPPSRIIYLRVSVDRALERLTRSRTRRPLLAGPDPRGALERLFAERAAAYERADDVVDTEGLTVAQVARAVAAVALRVL